jgi:hypothetical protein
MAAVKEIPTGSRGGRDVHLIVTDKGATIGFDSARRVLEGLLVLLDQDPRLGPCR